MKKHNILLISIDTLRADHLSCYGYHRKTTPNIDRLASEGTIYKQHYSTGVWTPPGHASMLTGLYVSEHGVYGERRLSKNIPTIAEKLKENGYQTAGFVNNSQVGELVGLHKGHDLFVEVWKESPYKNSIERILKGSLRRVKDYLGYEDKGAKRTNSLFLDWISRIDRNKPFYCFLHYIEPHNPLNPPRNYKNKYLDKEILRNVDMEKIKKVAHNPLICYVEDITLNNTEIETLKALYDGEIEYTDSKVGEIIALLKENNLYDDTMIIVTSDHGEHFGEYGYWSHVASLYKEILHIPLVIKYPKGVEYIEEINDYTQLVDIFPTIMEIAGVSEQEFQTSGINLTHNRDNSKFHEYIFAEWEGRVPYFIQDKVKGNKGLDINRFNVQMSMIQDKQYKYIWKIDGNEELYDISNSKEELLNITTQKEIKERLQSELLKKKKTMRYIEESTSYSIDNEIAKNLKALGYM